MPYIWWSIGDHGCHSMMVVTQNNGDNPFLDTQDPLKIVAVNPSSMLYHQSPQAYQVNVKVAKGSGVL